MIWRYTVCLVHHSPANVRFHGSAARDARFTLEHLRLAASGPYATGLQADLHPMVSSFLTAASFRDKRTSCLTLGTPWWSIWICGSQECRFEHQRCMLSIWKRRASRGQSSTNCSLLAGLSAHPHSTLLRQRMPRLWPTINIL